jgi:3-dehydroquinate synthetase
MLLESRLSNKIGVLSDKDLEDIEVILSQFPMVSIEEQDLDRLISIMRNDKKNKEGQIKGILINEIGKCDFDFRYDEEILKQVLSSLTVN